MKKNQIFTLLLLLLIILNSCVMLNNSSTEIDATRIAFINKMAKYLNDYFEIKGYYPFADGEYSLPVCIYLSSNLEEVDYPVHYDNVTVFDYKVLINELQLVLGPNVDIENDPIESNKNAKKYIARYYCAGNTFLLTANLFKGNKLTVHNRFPSPDGQNINNKSQITKFSYNPGFMNRYSIGSISNADQFIYSLDDYNRIVELNYDIPELDKDLLNAINSKDYNKVLNFINNGVSINPIHRNFNQVSSPLIFAVMNNDLIMVKLLLENGANVNARGSYEDVVLIYALSQEKINTEMVDLLLEYGANVNIPNFFGISPFIGVCMSGNVELARLFIESGANLNQDFFYYYDNSCNTGLTPIKAAISEGHFEVVELLIEYKCEVKKGTPGDKQSPLDYAIELSDDRIISLIKMNL